MRKLLPAVIAAVLICSLVSGCAALTDKARRLYSSAGAAEMPGMSVPFELKYGDIHITGTDDNPASAAEYTSKGERGFAVTIQFKESAVDNSDTFNNIILKPVVKDTKGAEYRQVLTSFGREGTDFVITFLYILPEETDLGNLTIWMNGEGRRLR